MYDVLRRQFILGSLAAGLAGHDEVVPSADERPTDDTIVRTTGELEKAFRNLSPGETVRISAENAPYRTTEWLDVDVDGVTVAGPGIKHLIVPADGANVGGIRIGHNDRCEEVDVRWAGFHGNPDGQSPDAKRRHGFLVRDAENVTIQGNYVTRTHPYHVHNAGGSGISVEQAAADVRILYNRIEDIGDRGIQVAGTGILIAGNVLTDGYDRSISLDVPPGDGNTYRAQNVIVTENLLGNNQEGSLVGIGGPPQREGRGGFTVSDNVGFGRHKHLCHLGFGGSARDVQIQGNTGVQDADNSLAGVSVDIERATNVTIRDNALYGYSGRGVNVAGDITDFVVSGNNISNPGASAVRVAGATDGTVADNFVEGAAGRGVVLDGARYVSVTGNRVRGTVGAAVQLLGGDGPAYHLVADNYVRAYGTGSGAPGIAVHVAGITARGNYLLGGEGQAIVEGEGARDNRYRDNLADSASPWSITSPSSMVWENTPSIDVHRGLTADDGGTVTVDFEKPYVGAPKIALGRRGGGVEGLSYETDEQGNYTGVTVTLAEQDAPLDVFVEAIAG